MKAARIAVRTCTQPEPTVAVRGDFAGSLIRPSAHGSAMRNFQRSILTVLGTTGGSHNYSNEGLRNLWPLSTDEEV